MIVLRVQAGALIRRRGRVADSHIVLDKPLVDGLGSMRHEYPAFEVGFAEDIWKC